MTERYTKGVNEHALKGMKRLSEAERIAKFPSPDSILKREGLVHIGTDTDVISARTRTVYVTNVQVAPATERGNFAGYASTVLTGFNRMPRDDRGYEEGRRSRRIGEDSFETIAVQVFPYRAAAPQQSK